MEDNTSSPRRGSASPVRGDAQESVTSLMEANSYLRSQLRDLSGKLDEAMKVVQNRADPMRESLQNKMEQKEVELNTANKKISIYKKDVETLRKQLTENSSFDRVVGLENEVKQLKDQLSTKDGEIRGLMNIKRDQESTITKMNAAQGDLPKKENDLKAEVSKLKQDLHEARKEKDKLETDVKIKHQAAEDLKQRTRKLTDEEKRLRAELKQAKESSLAANSNPSRSDEATQVAQLQAQVDVVTKQRDAVQKALDTLRSRHAKEQKDMEEKRKSLDEERRKLEQSNNIKDKRVEELRRSLLPKSRPSPLRQAGANALGSTGDESPGRKFAEGKTDTTGNSPVRVGASSAVASPTKGY